DIAERLWWLPRPTQTVVPKLGNGARRRCGAWPTPRRTCTTAERRRWMKRSSCTAARAGARPRATESWRKPSESKSSHSSVRCEHRESLAFGPLFLSGRSRTPSEPFDETVDTFEATSDTSRGSHRTHGAGCGPSGHVYQTQEATQQDGRRPS